MTSPPRGVALNCDEEVVAAYVLKLLGLPQYKSVDKEGLLGILSVYCTVLAKKTDIRTNLEQEDLFADLKVKTRTHLEKALWSGYVSSTSMQENSSRMFSLFFAGTHCPRMQTI